MSAAQRQAAEGMEVGLSSAGRTSPQVIAHNIQTIYMIPYIRLRAYLLFLCDIRLFY